MSRDSGCAACGMAPGRHPREYHPHAMCLMMRHAGSVSARANLRAVVEYGMRAHDAGITLDQAMNDMTLIHAAPVDQRGQS